MSGLVRRREEAAGAGRLVLAFDAGCVTCSELARRIRQHVGERLELRSLRDPRVREWRGRALGEDAPWAPTLIEVRGTAEEIRAWTGPGMAIHLGRALGPLACWRVMQSLGEMGAEAASERLGERPLGSLTRAVSRGQFLKGAGGALAGAAVLAGFGWVPLATNGRPTAQAQAQEQAPTYTYRELTGSERDSYVINNYYYNPHFQLLWNHFYAYGFKPRPDAARVVAVTHTASGGYTYYAYDLRVPFERAGEQYPVLSVTANQYAADTSMAVFQRVSETDQASRVDVYRVVRTRRRRQRRTVYEDEVSYARSWQGPFPLLDVPAAAAQEAAGETTAPASELVAPQAAATAPTASAASAPEGTTPEGTTPEGTTPEGTAPGRTAPEGTAPAAEASAASAPEEVTAPQVLASEAMASEETTTSVVDASSCEDCGRIVEAIAASGCYYALEVGPGLVCFRPYRNYVEFGSCEPQSGAVIAAVCAAGVPGDRDTACSPFCANEELVREALAIIRSSAQYLELEVSLKRKAGDVTATYDFDDAEVEVSPNGYFATVALPAIVEEKIVSRCIPRQLPQENREARRRRGLHPARSWRDPGRGQGNAARERGVVAHLPLLRGRFVQKPAGRRRCRIHRDFRWRKEDPRGVRGGDRALQQPATGRRSAASYPGHGNRPTVLRRVCAVRSRLAGSV